MRATFGNQLRAMLSRNLLIKKRNRRQLAQEIFTAVYMIIILVVVRVINKPQSYVAEPVHAPVDLSTWDATAFPAAYTLGYVPSGNAQVEAVMTAVHDAFVGGTPPTLRAFASAAAAATWYADNPSEIWAIVDFNATKDAAEIAWPIQYTIRMNGTAVPSTATAYSTNVGDCRVDNSCPSAQYVTSGFMWLMNAVDAALFSLKVSGGAGVGPLDMPAFNFSAELYPMHAAENPNDDVFKTMAPIYYVFSFLPLVQLLMVNVVTDKEKKIREAMKMMGLHEAAFFLAWFITYVAVVVVVMLVGVAISVVGTIFSHSNFFLVFVLFLLYGISLIAWGLCLSTFFSNAKAAGVVGALSALVASLIQVPIERLDAGLAVKYACSLFSPAAFSMGVTMAIDLEGTGEGLQFDNALDGDFSIGSAYLMLIIDIKLYLVLAWYLDNVLPSEYGVRKHPLFFLGFRRQVSGGSNSSSSNNNRAVAGAGGGSMVQQAVRRASGRKSAVGAGDAGGESLTGGAARPGRGVINGVGEVAGNEHDFEAMGEEWLGKEAIVLDHVSKEYPEGSGWGCGASGATDKLAVDQLSITLYEGQIFALLGHNGAGKSTTVGMISGLFPQTRGSISVYGRDTLQSMDDIRTDMGVCPQHDILFAHIEVGEHLRIYGLIKGILPSDIDAVVDGLLDEIDLAGRRHAMAHDLSGGQKRKLSVGIALIGQPKVLLLDEPTSGMDPYSRRKLWNLLQSKREGRVTLLTTHFMDEADILADRKAVMSSGHLQCVGSSLFLKNRFGVGYHVVCVKAAAAAAAPVGAAGAACDVAALTQWVQSQVPAAALGRDVAGEVTFVLPLSAAASFETFFRELRANQQRFGVSAFGVTMTTLEEVFLRLRELQEEEEHRRADADRLAVARAEEASGLLGRLRKGLRQSDVTIDAVVASSASASSSATAPAGAGEARNSSSSVAESVGAATSGAKLAAAQSAASQLGGAERTASLDLDGGVPNAPDSKTQLKTMIGVNVRVMRRNPRSFVFPVLIPIVFVVIGLILLSGNTPESGSQQSALDLSTAFTAQVTRHGRQTLAYMNLTGSSIDTLLGGLNVSNTDEVLGNSSLALNKWLFARTLGTASFVSEFVNVTSSSTAADAAARSLVFHNGSLVHSLPATVHRLANAYLDMAEGGNGGDDVPLIQASSQPFNSNAWTFDNTVFISIFLIGNALGLQPGAFAIEIVRDRERKIKHQLYTLGLPRYIYWVAIFIADVTLYMVAAISTLILMACFQLTAFVGSAPVLSTLLLFLLYMPTMVVYAYTWSYAFDRAETCQQVLPTTLNILGLIPYFLVSALDMSGDFEIAKTLHYILAFIDPSYTFFGTLYFIYRVDFVAQINNATPSFSQYWEFDNVVVGTLLIILLHFVIFSFMVWFLDYLRYTKVTDLLACFKKSGGRGGRRADGALTDAEREWMRGPAREKRDREARENEDDDVNAERQMVCTSYGNWARRVEKEGVAAMAASFRDADPEAAAGGGMASVEVVNLHKAFATKGDDGKTQDKTIIPDLCLRVSRGELFGLLGPNGAGKTTLLSCMTGAVKPDNGTAVVAGYDIRTNLTDAFRAMGYCAQMDALYENLTVKETLHTYGRLRGVDPAQLKRQVNYLIAQLDLSEHANRRCKTLSGGTQRKVSLALAIIGWPSVVYMDEPSTGMDAAVRRKLWRVIETTLAGRAGVLTTHSMEEADALSTRIGILVKGRLRCVGPSQHLKQKFGDGYHLEIKCAAARVDEVHAFVMAKFPEATLAESFGGRRSYLVGSDVDLADVFGHLRQSKEELGVEEYSFSQTTLEQVFLRFAKEQDLGDQDQSQDLQGNADFITNTTAEGGSEADVAMRRSVV